MDGNRSNRGSRSLRGGAGTTAPAASSSNSKGPNDVDGPSRRGAKSRRGRPVAKGGGDARPSAAHGDLPGSKRGRHDHVSSTKNPGSVDLVGKHPKDAEEKGRQLEGRGQSSSRNVGLGRGRLVRSLSDGGCDLYRGKPTNALVASVLDAIHQGKGHKDAIADLNQQHQELVSCMESSLEEAHREVAMLQETVKSSMPPPGKVPPKTRHFKSGDELVYTWGHETGWLYGKKDSSYDAGQESNSWWSRLVHSSARAVSPIVAMARFNQAQINAYGTAQEAGYYDIPLFEFSGNSRDAEAYPSSLFSCFGRGSVHQEPPLGRVVDNPPPLPPRQERRHGGGLPEGMDVGVLAMEDRAIGGDEEEYFVPPTANEIRLDRAIEAEEKFVRMREALEEKAEDIPWITTWQQLINPDEAEDRARKFFPRGQWKVPDSVDFGKSGIEKTVDFIAFKRGVPTSSSLKTRDSHFTESLHVTFMEHIWITDEDQRWIRQRNVDLQVQSCLAVCDVERWSGGGLVLGFIEPYRKVVRERCIVDRAMLVELLAPDVIGVSEDMTIKESRLRQAAASLRSVNVHKDFDMVSDYLANTVELAVAVMKAKFHSNRLVSEKISQHF